MVLSSCWLQGGPWLYSGSELGTWSGVCEGHSALPRPQVHSVLPGGPPVPLASRVSTRTQCLLCLKPSHVLTATPPPGPCCGHTRITWPDAIQAGLQS